MLGKLFFSILMLALAALRKWNSFDALSVGLGVAAGLPWILGDLQSMLKSVKVNGVVDMEFRDLKQQVESQQNALDTGVGGIPAFAAAAATAATASTGAHSMATPSADEPGSRVIASDPNKNRFGGSPTRAGLALRATVLPFPGSDVLFRVQLRVESATPFKTGDLVRFHLNSTFIPPVVDVTPNAAGIAEIERVARTAFIVGAEVHTRGQIVLLELDLATAADQPIASRFSRTAGSPYST